MQTFVMSDVHGRADAYFDILKQIDFEHFNDRDRLYILGDVIDRGSGGIKILQHIMSNQKHIKMLSGNHEKMLLDSIGTGDLHNWCNHNGGDVTLANLLKLDFDEQGKILEFLFDLPYHKEVIVDGKTYYLVHGSPHIKKSKYIFDEFKKYSFREKMLWRQMSPKLTLEGKIVIFGHRYVGYYHKNNFVSHQFDREYSIYKGEKMIGIDCGCAGYRFGKLGCLRLQDMAEFYADFKR